ncbi:unnamed protein product [Closterium sp. Naga37s-1]|nr:unnamed protein product [Closterium sp. Naga37s-1]
MSVTPHSQTYTSVLAALDLPCQHRVGNTRPHPRFEQRASLVTLTQHGQAVSRRHRAAGYHLSSSAVLDNRQPQLQFFLRSSKISRVSRRAPSRAVRCAANSLQGDALSGDTGAVREEGADVVAGATVIAATQAGSEEARGEAVEGQGAEKQEGPRLACPVCLRPLDVSFRSKQRSFSMQSAPSARLQCAPCRRTYTARAGFADLVLTAGVTQYIEPPLPSRSETFKNPLVSFAYERGWRQSFAGFGFPGPDEEFLMAQRLFHEQKGGLLVDLSCGSGLFTRRFAASQDWRHVAAADLSPAMLEQTAQYIRDDPLLREQQSAISLLRVDVSRLPFPSASVDAIHAGAALHCWPSPSLAMAEISRVLRPGGRFVATTFLLPKAPIADELFKPLRKQLSVSQQLPFRYWEPEELEELMGLAGLENYTSDIRSQYIMLSAQKPSR